MTSKKPNSKPVQGLSPQQALDRYREGVLQHPNARDNIAAFNAMSIDDRIELTFLMLHAVNVALADIRGLSLADIPHGSQ